MQLAIELNIYGDTSFNILKDITSCYTFGGMPRKFNYFRKNLVVGKTPSGNIFISRNSDIADSGWDLFRDGVSKGKAGLADILKQLAKNCIGYYGLNYNWKRTNINSLEFKNARYTIQSLYCLYDLLKGRKHVNLHYPKEVLDEICGKEIDPMSAEINNVISKNIFDIYKNASSEQTALSFTTYNNKCKWYNEYTAKVDALQKEYIEMSKKERYIAYKAFFESFAKNANAFGCSIEKMCSLIVERFPEDAEAFKKFFDIGKTWVADYEKNYPNALIFDNALN